MVSKRLSKKYLITISLLTLSLLTNVIVVTQSQKEDINSSYYSKLSLLPADRPFGENTNSAPVRVCANYLLKDKDISDAEVKKSQSELRTERIKGDIATYSRGTIDEETYKRCIKDNVRFITYGDANGDFLSEVLIFDNSGRAYLFLNKGGSFKKQEIIVPRKPSDTSLSPYKGIAIFGDVDNDKLNDLIFSPAADRSYLVIIKNLGENLYDFNTPIFVETETHPGVPDSVITDDFNKDGIIDILVTVRTSWASVSNTLVCNKCPKTRMMRIFISEGGAAPYFKEQTRAMIPLSEANEPTVGGAGDTPFSNPQINAKNKVLPFQPFMPIVHDFDGDSELDIFIAGDVGGSRVLFQEGGRFIDYSISSSISSSTAGMGAELYDFNHDGLLDIFTTEITKDSSTCFFERPCDYASIGNNIFINNGDRTFQASGNHVSAKFHQDEQYSKLFSDYNPGLRNTGFGWGFSSIDLNMDGYLDYFIGNGFNSTGRTNGEWSATFDKPYLLLGGSNNTWFDATGDIFRSFQMLGTTQYIGSTDFDGDFRPDLLIAGEDEYRPHLLLNTTKENNAAALIVRGKGLGGSPYNGEGSVITVEIKNKPDQKFKLPSKLSNYHTYGATAPLLIGLGIESEAIITVLFPTGKVEKRKITKNKVNVISE